MAFLFRKFQEAVKTMAKNPMFARDPRQIQLEADVNRLFLYTSYNRLGRDANETDAEEIIDMASKASFSDQQKQVQENIHYQIKTFCSSMDEILLPKSENISEPIDSSLDTSGPPHRSGLSLAIGKCGPSTVQRVVPETLPLSQAELSNSLKDHIGYTLEVRQSQIPHKEAGQGLFLSGEVGVGAVVAFYPGVIYSPAYYRYIPGYPKVDANNPYLITRFDGIVINALPWGVGGGNREIWNGLSLPQLQFSASETGDSGSDRLWKLISKPLEGSKRDCSGEILERRNPLALGHFSNHPAKGMVPNVIVCPYDFPLTEKEMRTYIPNTLFGNNEPVKMRRLGSFWFRSGESIDSTSQIPVLRTLVLVATRALCDEEILLNYRLSNSKRRPAWYTPVDEEEDRRRWS